MKTKILIRITLLAFLITASGACSKQLEEKPVSFVSPDNFFQTAQQVETAFAASMNFLWNYWGGYSYGYGSFIHDDQLNGGDLNLSASHGSGLWNIHYRALVNINAAIAAIKNGNLQGVPQADIDRLTGQAKFLRAYNYFMLVRMFGGVPLITEETPDPIANPMPRASISEVYALIVSDFTEAANKLPASWAGARGKPTSGAAKGLLAKVYLTMATAPLNETGNYQKAADLAWEVIQSGQYSLVTNIHEVFSLSNKYGPEMMWSFNSTYDDPATDPQIWAPENMDGWGDASVNPVWEQAIPDNPRKDAYLITELNGVHYADWDAEHVPYIRKFLYISQEDFDSYASTINFPIIRYADVLLIYAEAANMANGAPTQAAVNAINLVIDRANGYAPVAGHPLLTTAMSKDAFDVAVIEERNQELCFEFDRWFDLVRKKLLREKNPEWEANFSENDYLFPIPERDLRLNDLLEQNPGYPTP
ncbi:MAG: RagB/SusD family nutrient uptake outer membrane protein [Chitinophagaceae bacterium]|nr:RagB/SusD family nutrient uptake outer membrane protein [Chitinophagaceae bacterium]MCW5925698.1 RagB/SusD family nutrient uptake outer membrane protein [Chitinophagaceae bacterium]